MGGLVPLSPLTEDEFAARMVEAQVTLRGYILAHVWNHADAEDVFQDVAKALWERQEAYDQEKPFARWAMGFARNKVMSYHRTRKRSKLLFDDSLLNAFEARYEALEDELADRRRALRHCMAELPERSRRLLQLRYGEGQAIAAIAATIGKTRNNVRVIFSRIYGALRKCISFTVSANALETEPENPSLL
jgi:RNA polymerase sigma-70 factor (ECF subfamily)